MSVVVYVRFGRFSWTNSKTVNTKNNIFRGIHSEVIFDNWEGEKAGKGFKLYETNLTIMNSLFVGFGHGSTDAPCIDSSDSPKVVIERTKFTDNVGGEIGSI